MKKLLWLCIAVAIAGCGRGKSTDEWIDRLHAPDSAERVHAVKALAARGGEAEVIVPALAQSLHDPDTFVRRDAAQALGRFGPDAAPALPALRPLLRDRHASVRRAAANALQEIDPAMAARAAR